MKIEQMLIEDFDVFLGDHPYAKDFFESFGLKIEDNNTTVAGFIDSTDDIMLEDLGLNKEILLTSFKDFMSGMLELNEDSEMIQSVTIIGGNDKSGEPEDVEFTINRGEIICIVGPTGSGKSRLLADIEWLSQKDTPTKRQILINGKRPDKKWRFSTEHKLVAQLSQNMNFVMDLSASDFIKLHAESRLVENPEEKTMLILKKANELAGEPFSNDTQVTSLSGGQSRALMIADIAYLSKSPIVLIDEIENAGIDRKKALEILVKEEKIILLATHDPLLALRGDKRLVIKNGGISKVIKSSEKEFQHLGYLEELDNKLMTLRNRLRNGEILEVI